MSNQEFLREISIQGKLYRLYNIQLLAEKGVKIARLPFSIRVLVENLLRNMNGSTVTEKDLEQISNWKPWYMEPVEIPYHPGRVLMQDFTGVPAVVDLAAMRDAIKTQGGDPKKINPLIPVDLVVDHSVQVDHYGTPQALEQNVTKEYERNSERYAFLKWAQKNFDNFKAVPPNSGICHQVNLEYLASVVMAEQGDDAPLLYPDTLVGTDSHTTMINGTGVMGWGVGGIEAEAVMLGQPYFMSIPEVVGMRMNGKLRPGVTTTDLALTVTQILREQKVVEKFVEFFGEGSKNLNVMDRATIANMSPEYGATMGFFPVDEQTIQYLEMTNRAEQARITEAYTKEIGLFYTGEEEPEYSKVIELDLASVEPCLAGPSRPQDRITLRGLKAAVTPAEQESVFVQVGEQEMTLSNGSIVIAAITSCTNTSNPFVLIGAALLAKNAVAKGLKVPPQVKTSFAPGSTVVADYLRKANLLTPLEELGFHIAAFGCTTCIGNSGPLDPAIEQAITDNGLSVASVLSGNRNFEARIHQKIKGNFLASPMLVVAFALGGRIDMDLENEPLGQDAQGEPVFLRDIWPDETEIQSLINEHLSDELFQRNYATIFDGDTRWQEMPVAEETTFPWDESSNYIKNPPYFTGFQQEISSGEDTIKARALLLLADSVTTDHISPAGAIPEAYPAGKYLLGQGVGKEEFNSYGSRRGNHEVMMRGTFGNIRIKNQLVAPKEGSFTRKFPEDEEMSVYEAAMKYQQEGTPLVVLAGKEYGTGSSRDWAAKGTQLLGVKAVIAESYERIHRSNLVGMGVLPLQFSEGESWQSLGLDGSESFVLTGLGDMKPGKSLLVRAEKADGSIVEFTALAKLNTDIEVTYYQHGGILPYVLRKLMS
ncbi:MAG: aconitate hydratase AcnA [Candidatus Electrothrix aestuarii]|uniref:Aconitate hydratase n=1 Tax=Candidatus Electrothrix aestuarii TaxID=3062594 RepID=A0AAU8LTN2_9BACT|nr:aconitate hydratase AcnA [Candidatus Electrothrix aestuarii]